MDKESADKALAGYFDDLLGAEQEAPVQKVPPPSEVRPKEPAPVAEVPVAAPMDDGACESEPVPEPPSVISPSEPAPKVSRPQSPPQAHRQEVPPHALPAKPEPRAQPKTQQEAAMDLSMLEEQKRLKLQRMLSQQVVAPAPVKEDVPVEVKPQVTEVQEIPTPVEAPTVKEAEVVAEASTCETEAYLKWGENGRPLWAQEEFDVLLFEVSGLSLAVPLVALGHIVPLDKKLTILQGQSEWFMGILPASVGDIRTINTALFVMPERYNGSFVDQAKYVVTIDGLPWGLAVDGVHQPIRLTPEDVKWRSERGKRPWIAGTVKSHMCALIDIPQMAQLLEDSDKNRAVH